MRWHRKKDSKSLTDHTPHDLHGGLVRPAGRLGQRRPSFVQAIHIVRHRAASITQTVLHSPEDWQSPAGTPPLLPTHHQLSARQLQQRMLTHPHLQHASQHAHEEEGHGADTTPMQMDKVPLKRRYFLIAFGSFLSLLAGYINGVTMLHSAPISHMTGATTNAGLALASGNWPVLAVFGLLLFAYLFGGVVSGSIVGDTRFRWSRRYGWILLLESLALYRAYLDLDVPLIPSAGLPFGLGSLWACFACGLQNACTTTFSGAVIRTTHVSGLMSDVGIIIGQMLFWKDLRTKNIWKLQVLIPLYMGFLFGGTIAYFGYIHLGKQAILYAAIPLGVAGTLHALHRIVRRWQKMELGAIHLPEDEPSVTEATSVPISIQAQSEGPVHPALTSTHHAEEHPTEAVTRPVTQNARTHEHQQQLRLSGKIKHFLSYEEQHETKEDDEE